MPIEPFYAALGRRIHDARGLLEITQEELGSRLTPPMKRASIANIETGKQRVLAHTLTQLARALQTSIEALVPDEAAKASGGAEGLKVEHELERKLGLPAEVAKKIAAKLGTSSPETK
ncbi:MAG: helix-turn-helix transcriptional regulator [Myxococcales bacterium]